MLFLTVSPFGYLLFVLVVCKSRLVILVSQVQSTSDSRPTVPPFLSVNAYLLPINFSVHVLNNTHDNVQF